MKCSPPSVQRTVVVLPLDSECAMCEPSLVAAARQSSASSSVGASSKYSGPSGPSSGRRLSRPRNGISRMLWLTASALGDPGKVRM